MKIRQVKTYHVQAPVTEKFANSGMWNTSRGAHIVEVIADNGLIGWGEGSEALKPSALDSLVIGRSPFDCAAIWQALYENKISPRAISGLDIALWDLKGKALEMPIYELLGGAVRRTIPAYASGLFCKDCPDVTGALVDEAKSYVDLGFPAMKMKVGFGEAYDVKNVTAVRRAIGDDILFAVDANCAYDVATAIDIGRKMMHNDLLWYEEPILSDDVRGYLEIKQALGLRIAGAEALAGRWAFRELIQQRALDIVQPDISIAGGFTECRIVAGMASANYIRVLPHMWGGQIRLAATVHWQATLPDWPKVLHPFPSLFEYDMTENALRTDLARNPIQARDGELHLPTEPGLGIEIDREVLHKYRV
jgi:D-galactarolactone cycloisomerase